MPVADAIKTGNEAYLERFKLFIYGWPGSGKTTLAATSPRPLVIEFDDGGHVVLGNLPPEIRAGVRWYETQSWDKAVRFLRDLVRDKKYLEEIDTIVVDTISSLQSIERARQIAGVDVLVEEKSPFNEAVYASNNFRIVKFVEVLLSTGKNLILTSQMTEDTITVGALQKKQLRPGLSPALNREIMAMMDCCYFLELNGGTRTLRVLGSPDLLIKSRFKTGSQPIIRDPDWSTLQGFISTLQREKAAASDGH
jgi:nucleoside-triphosphatase THEP1